jgi:Protein of unknown function (DUF2637)
VGDARMNGSAHTSHSSPTLAPRPARASTAHEPGESWLLRTGLSVSVWLLAGVATLLAASGQVQFARWAGIADLRAYAVPAVLELVAVAFMLIGYRRARRGDSPSTLWLLAALVGAFAVYTNVVHSGGRAGLVFGAASAITLILWFVKLRDDYRQFQRQTGQATRPRPKLGALWVVAPRLSARAWVIAARRRISTVDGAVGLAEVWRAVYEDSRTAKVRRRLARRTAWRSVAQAAGGMWAELPRTAEVAAVDVVQRSSLVRGIKPGPDGGQRPDDRAAIADTGGFPRTDVAVVPAVVGDASGAASLRARVYAFLDSQVKIDEYFDVGDGDDPYLLWLTARGLGVGVDAVAQYVHEWCQQASNRTLGQASDQNSEIPLATGSLDRPAIRPERHAVHGSR